MNSVRVLANCSNIHLEECKVCQFAGYDLTALSILLGYSVSTKIILWWRKGTL